MEMNNNSSSSHSSYSSYSRMVNMLQPSTKTERKVIEKNRRNQMKTLYSILDSLIPKHPSKEPLPLPDQIDEAISYIKNLEAKVKKSEEKKQTLSKKRPCSCLCSSQSAAAAAPVVKSPKIEVREMGSSLEIILISGSENQSLFNEIISILHEENVDVVSASSSLAGDSLLHVVHAQMNESGIFSFGAARVTERLNRFINGSTSEIELEPELWDFNDLQPETWIF
ncbi:basic helix-loop-helix (bHLH) DNA-binding superfamily protein [Euphorbia peplus]|nr:basic helix-loop-helix (bHLH) DNA-binding superfamily protein [Euphorbia peplus]